MNATIKRATFEITDEEAIILRHAPDHSALLAEVGRLTKERDERWTELDCSYVNMVQKLSSLVRSILVSYERGASQDVWPKVEEMRDWMELKHPYVADLKRLVADHENRIAQLATLRRERDELRAELLTTHQMACRVGLERDELAKLLGEAADELAVPGYDAPPISKGVQNLLSRIRAALQSLRALTEQPGKP